MCLGFERSGTKLHLGGFEGILECTLFAWEVTSRNAGVWAAQQINQGRDNGTTATTAMENQRGDMSEMVTQFANEFERRKCRVAKSGGLVWEV